MIFPESSLTLLHFSQTHSRHMVKYIPSLFSAVASMAKNVKPSNVALEILKFSNAMNQRAKTTFLKGFEPMNVRRISNLLEIRNK